MFCRCVKSTASGRAGGYHYDGKDLGIVLSYSRIPHQSTSCSVGLNFYQEQCFLGTVHKKTRILFCFENIYLSWILSCWLWTWLCHIEILRTQVYVRGNKTLAVLKTFVLSLQSSFVLKRILLSWDFYWNGLLSFQEALRGTIFPPISFWQKWEQSCNRALSSSI